MKAINKRLLTLILIFTTFVFGGVSFFTAKSGILASAATTATITSSDVFSSNSTGTGAMRFCANENNAPYSGEWDLRYKPRTTDAVKLIRNGEIKNVGNTGAETIVKYEPTKYSVEGWAISQGANGWMVGDVYVLNGEFYNSANDATIIFENVELHIVSITDGKPVVIANAINAGKMYVHPNGTGHDGAGVWFSMAKNSAPTSSTYGGSYYNAMSSDLVQLTRNGQTSSLSVAGRNNVMRRNATEYYLRTEQWCSGTSYAPQEGDVLTVGGYIVCASGDGYSADKNVVLFIEKTTLTYSNGKFSFDSDVKTKSAVMSAHQNGGTSTGVYVTMPENEGLYDSDWNIEYKPTSSDNIIITRGGQNLSVANVGAGTLVKYSPTEYYLKFEQWTNANLPLQDGDVVTVGGDFVGKDFCNVTISVAQTVITYSNGTFTFGVPKNEAGMMTSHENGVNLNENSGNGFGFYFYTDENNAKYSSDWSVEYGATTVDNIKLTRNGVTTSVAIVGQGLIVRLSQTSHYFKVVPWTASNVLPLQDGDVFTISGEFQCTSDESQTFTITETTVEYYKGMIFFSTDNVVKAGKIQKHPTNGASTESIYFTMQENSAPFNDKWSVRYVPMCSSAIQRVRNGETTNVGGEGETIVKYSQTEYNLQAWAIGGIQDGDLFIVDGYFKHKATGTILKIERTYLSYSNGEVSIVEDGFSMVKGASVRLNSSKMGIRFTASLGFDYDKSASYYVMIVPKHYLTLLNVTDDYYTKLKEILGENEYIANMQAEPFVCEESDQTMQKGFTYIRGSLTNLNYENMNTKFFGIAYMVKDGVYTYAKFNQGENERSLVEISSLALREQSKYSADNVKVLKGFVNRGMNNALGNQDSNEFETVELKANTLNHLNGYPINTRLSLGIPDGADVVVDWSSSDPETIAVDQNGNVIGLKTGSATITAVCMGNTYVCQVTNQAGARPLDLKKRGAILSWEPLAEIQDYKVTILGSNTSKEVKGLMADLSTFGLTKGQQYTVGVSAIINGIETDQSVLEFVYDDYSSAYYYAVATETANDLSVGVWTGSNHFNESVWFEEYAKAGYDLVIGVNPLWHGSKENFIKNLDVAYANGVKIIVDVRSYAVDSNGNGYYKWWDGNVESVQQTIQNGSVTDFCKPSEYLTHPAIISVLGWDEPYDNDNFKSGDGVK